MHDFVIDLERGGIVESGTFVRTNRRVLWQMACTRWKQTARGNYGKWSELFPPMIHSGGSRIMAFPVFSRWKNPGLRVVVLDADGKVGKRTFCAGMSEDKPKDKRRVPSYPVSYGIHRGADQWDERGTDGCSDIFVKFSCGKQESRVIGTDLDEDLRFNDGDVARDCGWVG